jgi:putative Holliday junction resolvase
VRLLGVDFGFTRIGIAIAETEPPVVTARPPLAASGGLKRDAKALAELARKEEVGAVVVGLPLEDGEEQRMARIARQLAEHLKGEGLTVHLVDETLSSVVADQGLREAGLKASQRRKLRDGEAAALILERYLHGEETE